MSGDRSGSDAGSLRSGASGPAIDEASIADTERYDPVPPVALMIPVDPKMCPKWPLTPSPILPTPSHNSDTMERNPFAMPKGDTVEEMRDTLRRMELREKAHQQSLSVFEKTTFVSRQGGTMAAALAEVSSPRGVRGGEDLGGTRTNEELIADTLRRGEGHGRENLKEFISKKREIFLTQMSLDVKLAEIRKLETRALRREEALTRSEQMLEEDALRFEGFLKENDLKVQEAIRLGEAETKHKNDALHEMKRINAQMTLVKTELSKTKDRLEDCRRYKGFLDDITDPEFFNAVLDAKRMRQTERREQRRAVRNAYAAIVNAIGLADQEIPEKKSALEEARRKGRKAEAAAQLELEAAIKAAQDAREAVDAEPSPPGTPENDDSDSEVPMYFTSPRQLPEIYAQLEEANLFLIQNAQETEEILEDLRNKEKETTERMDAENASLRAQVEQLEAQIASEEARATTLLNPAERKSKKKSGPLANVPPAPGADVPLERLDQKTAEMYARAGFAPDPSISTIQMLTNTEMSLERYLADADTMPATFVAEEEKRLERERRAKQRIINLELEKIAAEERRAKSIAKANEPVKRRTGKPLMTRSMPPSRKKKEATEKLDPEVEELNKFLAMDF